MLIRNLKLDNFRNYKNEKIIFSPKTNIFYGKNGQGKTNLLEAIYYLLTGKSYRAQKEKELILWSENNFHLYGDFLLSNRKVSLESHYGDKKKIVKINQVPCKKLSDFVGMINVIYFSPDDLIMVKGAPAERRRFLDLHIAQVLPSHVNLLNLYNKALNQKRALLKSNLPFSSKKSQIKLWNEQVHLYGAKIIENRWRFTQNLQEISSNIYKDISSQKEKMSILYLAIGEKKLETALSQLPKLLEEKIDQEIEQKKILAGPHKDDLAIMLDERLSRLYASQGQQRSLVLSLKLAELEIIKKEKGEYPLLLLDDVLSELDSYRREYLVRLINTSSIQTLITMTSADEAQVNSGVKFFVYQGQVRREN